MNNRLVAMPRTSGRACYVWRRPFHRRLRWALSHILIHFSLAALCILLFCKLRKKLPKS